MTAKKSTSKEPTTMAELLARAGKKAFIEKGRGFLFEPEKPHKAEPRAEEEVSTPKEKLVRLEFAIEVKA